MLLAERGNEKYTVHLTYPKKKGKPWSPKKQGLVALFDANPNFVKKVKIVSEKKPHLINLLDNL